MAQFTIYTSSDTDAPVLNGTSGSMCGVLNACLVSGYGSKIAAGWTAPYSESNKIVFRQGGGNQFYVRIEDSGSAASNTDWVTIGPVLIAPLSSSATWVELRNNYYSQYTQAPCYWDHIVTT